MRCDNCQYWQKPDTNGYYEEVGACNRAMQYFDATHYDKDDEMKTKVKPEYADVLMFVQDASDYSAVLLTKAEFGCVSHKPLMRGDRDE